MAEFLHRLRRGATQLAIRQAIASTAILPMDVQRSSICSLIALAGHLPMLRGRIRENMRLALRHDASRETLDSYFRHLGWFLSSALATFHRGVAGTQVLHDVKFDESIRVLDDAVAEGRGAIIVSPHWSGHELVAATVNRRHPMALLVRQAPTADRMARKLKWYKAVGAEIVLRPAQASTIKDAVAYLSVLKRGKVLAITPDLLADPGTGVETTIFGRKARIHGGAFALALSARAPMVRVYFRWQPDTSVIVGWERAPAVLECDRDAAIRAGVQNWCHWFEDKLRANPENWLFWLDKRWSRFLHATPREAGGE